MIHIMVLLQTQLAANNLQCLLLFTKMANMKAKHNTKLVLIKIYVALPMILQNRLVKHQALLFGLMVRLTISRLNKQNLLECLTTLRLKKKLTVLVMPMLVVS